MTSPLRLPGRPARRRAALVVLALAVLLPPVAQAADPAPRSAPAAYRVVLDPGHGGTEDGAIGPGGNKEKDIVLDIAKRLAALLRADGIDVALTREADDTKTLDERATVANATKADLFISLHVNASRFAKAGGAETYFLSNAATDDAARTTAALENDAARVGAEAQPSDDLALILWDMAQVEYLRESERLAETIQGLLNEALGLKDRGVRQAPFRVLVGTTSPAVLVELGFISNPDEEKQLASEAHRQKLAEVLAASVRSFRASSGARPADR